MIRRLIRQGANSYTLTVPVEWVRENNIKEGDEIRIAQEDSRLVVTTETKLKKKELFIDIKNFDEDTIKYVLYSAYRDGVQRLVLETKEKKSFDIVEDVSHHHFIGFEVIDKFKDKIVLEVITEPSNERFDSLLRKQFLVIKESMSILNEGFEKNSFTKIDELNNLVDRYRQIDNFCRRYLTLMKKNDINYSDYTNLIVHLMMLETDIRWHYVWCSKNKSSYSDVLKEWQKLADFFDKCTTAFFKDDKHSLSVLNESLRKHLYGYLLKKLDSSTKNKVSMHYISEDTRLLYSVISPMLGIVINNTKEKI